MQNPDGEQQTAKSSNETDQLREERREKMREVLWRRGFLHPMYRHAKAPGIEALLNELVRI